MMAGPGSMVLIAGVALLIFGPKKLPEIGKAMGDSLREFKRATRGLSEENEEANQSNEIKSLQDDNQKRPLN